MFKNIIFPLFIIAFVFSLISFADAGTVKDTLTETVTLKEQATTPAPPLAGQKQLFVDSDGKAKLQNSAGELSDVGGGGPEPWAATTDYTTDKLVIYLDVIYRALSDFTSGASFNPANWAEVGKTSDKVIGPGPTTTDGCLAAFDGAGGYTIKGTPLCVDGLGNLSGANDIDLAGNLTAGGYLTNGTVTIENSAITSTGGLSVDPGGDFTFKDSNNTDVKVGTNNSELGNLLKYPSFEESISEWFCDFASNCTLTQESGGIHPLTGGKFLRMVFTDVAKRVSVEKAIPATTENLTGYASCNFKSNVTGAQFLPTVGPTRKWQYQSAIPVSDSFQNVYVTFPIPIGTTQIGGQVDAINTGTIDADGECKLGLMPPTIVGVEQQGQEVVFAKNTTGCDVGIASDVTPICWAEVRDPYGLWDGTTFTPNETAVYTISFGASFTSAASRTFDLWRKVGSGSFAQYLMFSVGTSSTDGAGAFTTVLEAGNTYQVRTRNGGTLAVSTVTHTLSIAKFQSMKTASGTCTGGDLVCENTFGGYYDGSTTIAAPIPESLSMTLTKSGTSNVIKTIDISALNLTNAPICDTGNGQSTTHIANYIYTSSSNTQIVFYTADTAGNPGDYGFAFTCEKQGIDRNKSRVLKAILDDYVRMPNSGNIVEYMAAIGNGSGAVCSSSPCTIEDDFGFDWVASQARSGTGEYIFTSEAVFKPNSYVRCNLRCSRAGTAAICDAGLSGTVSTDTKSDSSGVVTLNYFTFTQTGTVQDALTFVECRGRPL